MTLDELAAAWRDAWASPDGGFEHSCTPDVRYEDPVAIEPLEGVDALEGHAALVRSAFPDLSVEASGTAIGDESLACIPWRAVGTHKGELGGLPATNAFVILQGVHYVELHHGAIRRARGFFDVYGAAMQLGLLPAHGSMGEKALLLIRGFGLQL
ncbi:MAG TPA: ester cyclase [Thermoleophilaceae bacterium]|nr:ester cyclase [Thermoleophilaceae bacterium]